MPGTGSEDSRNCGLPAILIANGAAAGIARVQFLFDRLGQSPDLFELLHVEVHHAVSVAGTRGWLGHEQFLIAGEVGDVEAHRVEQGLVVGDIDDR